MTFNQYSTMEGDRGAGELGTGELGTGEGGKRELSEGGRWEQKSKRHSSVVYYCLSSSFITD